MVFGESLVKSVDSSLEPIVVLAVTFVASKGLVKGSGTVTESITVVVAVPASVSVGGEVIISTTQRSQQRENTIRAFRAGGVWVLICTELLGRDIERRIWIGSRHRPARTLAGTTG